jgi:hypothetical protein
MSRLLGYIPSFQFIQLFFIIFLAVWAIRDMLFHCFKQQGILPVLVCFIRQQFKQGKTFGARQAGQFFNLFSWKISWRRAPEANSIAL